MTNFLSRRVDDTNVREYVFGGYFDEQKTVRDFRRILFSVDDCPPQFVKDG